MQNFESFNAEVDQLIKENHGFHYVHRKRYLNDNISVNIMPKSLVAEQTAKVALLFSLLKITLAWSSHAQLMELLSNIKVNDLDALFLLLNRQKLLQTLQEDVINFSNDAWLYEENEVILKVSRTQYIAE